MVGFVLVFQTTPRAVTKAPPSDPMDPPVVNELEVIAVAAEVALRVGKANCAAAPTIFTKLVPLYTCNSPFAPQSVHHRIRPASGETMADF